MFPILCGHLAEVVKSLFLGHSIYERQNPVLILSYLLTFQSTINTVLNSQIIYFIFELFAKIMTIGKYKAQCG